MTYDQFKKLNMDQQEEMVISEGVFLMGIENNAFIISLYQANNFYAEIYLFKENNQIVWLNSFQDTAKLDRYLEKIDLSELSDALS